MVDCVWSSRDLKPTEVVNRALSTFQESNGPCSIVLARSLLNTSDWDSLVTMQQAFPPVAEMKIYKDLNPEVGSGRFWLILVLRYFVVK